MTKFFIEKVAEESSRMLEQGLPRHKILAYLATAAESATPDGEAVSSILVLDKEGLLRNGASPRLPYDYLTAIDGLKPNAKVGTCCVAAATGDIVITTDFSTDEKWAELRHLPMSIGFNSAWSVPIKNDEGKVLGTFGTYFRDKRNPTPAEVETVKALAVVAARVLN